MTEFFFHALHGVAQALDLAINVFVVVFVGVLTLRVMGVHL